jgi:predicted metal-dependent peptidase
MTENIVPTPDQSQVLLRLHAARVIASEKQPYLSAALFAMVPVKVDGLGTLASDAKWRLYYDPIKIMEWPVEEVAAVLLHEVGHCIRDHARRFEGTGDRKNYGRIFNIAGDALINLDLRDDRLTLPEGAVYVETLNEQGYEVSREMSAEQIYQIMKTKIEDEACTCGDKGDQPENQEGDKSQKGEGGEKSEDKTEGEESSENGSGEKDEQSGEGEESDQNGNGGNGQPDPNCPVHNPPQQIGWDCGSAADGVKRDYEAEGDKVDAGVDEDRGDLIRQQVAVEIRNHVRNRGTVPGGYERWAKDLLEPVVDWRKELASLVRRSFAQVAGLRDYTYKRISRRDAAMKQMGQTIILPAMRQPNPPKVSIVIDTSGSMSDDMLSWALSETQGVLRSLGSSGRQVRVISCDAKATTQRVTNIASVKLSGGGGTDMRVGITEAMTSRDKPDVVIVLTDGYTPWPDEPLRGATLIVALTDDNAAGDVPTWARAVVVARND